MGQSRFLLALPIVTMIASPEAAEDRALEGREAVTTAKERLVNKAADPQRVNDCKVPAERRGQQQARPSDCPHLERNGQRGKSD
jgi:hypothetical protein